MDLHTLPLWYTTYKEKSLSGRYIHLDHITPLLSSLSQSAKVSLERIGSSENDLPIHLIKLGTGSKKLLYWSQMHGNESTTTKAIFDFLNTLMDDSLSLTTPILEACTLYIIPILSPDGANSYTRLNYNKVDLNRDAQDLTQKESIVLNRLIHQIKPDYAFNLHGQRTIFSAGMTNNSATVSFLSPAGDQERSVTPCRKIAMEIIANMNQVLQNYIPNCVGRYDDGFNINCVGDTLSSIGVPTILFEAGHYINDYNREQTREYIYYSLITSVSYITNNDIKGESYASYFDIPENGKCFYDIMIRDVILRGENVDIAIQYEEQLLENDIIFVPKVVKIEDSQKKYGHKEIIGKKRAIHNEYDTEDVVFGKELTTFLLNDELFSVDLRKT